MWYKEHMAKGTGTKSDPWILKTPPGTSEYKMYKDESLTPPAIVCVVGSTTLMYDLKAIDDLHKMLKKVTGRHLSADKLKKWYEEGKEFYVVDMRNDYEFEVGRFKNSIWPEGLGHFRDVPKAIKSIEKLKDKTVVTVCTGGVRCETASGLLIKYGFKEVYQLENGIVTFMEKYPNTYFEGKLLVFDQREMIGFNTEDPNHKIVGKCRICGEKSENLEDYFDGKKNTYGIICVNCAKSGKVELERKPTSHLTDN